MPFPTILDHGDFAQGDSPETLILPRPAQSAGLGLLIAYISHGNSAASLTPPSGWTLINDLADVNGSFRLFAFSKVETESEPSSYDWSGQSDVWSGYIDRITGFDGGDPINASAVGSAAAFGTTLAVPQPTTTAADCLVIQVVGTGAFARAISVYPTGYPDNHLAEARIDGGLPITRATAGQAVAGVAPSGTWTIDSGTDRFVALAFAIPYGVIVTPISAGTASFLASGPAGITMEATDASGGTAPYTYQWQRNEDGGSYSDLTDGGGVSGATTLELVDGSAVEDVLYRYKLVYTDDDSATATSNVVTAQIYSGGSIGGGSGSSPFQSSLIRGV